MRQMADIYSKYSKCYCLDEKSMWNFKNWLQPQNIDQITNYQLFKIEQEQQVPGIKLNSIL
jgi:hypothetical protein